MSDDESVISEDIEVASDDGSQIYDPAAYEEEEYSYQGSRSTEYPAKSSSLPPLSPAPPPNKSTLSKIFSNSPRPSNAITKRAESSVEYSANFDDDFEQESEVNDKKQDDGGDSGDAYSFDFDAAGIEESEEQSVSVSKPVTRVQPKPSSSAAAPAVESGPVPVMWHLPSLDLQAAQAELAIDEISKEVLRLRNRQRSLLLERRQAARDKKIRAESRRVQYQEEMKDMLSRVTAAEAKCEELALQLTQQTHQTQQAVQAKAVIAATLTSCEAQVSDLQTQVGELTKSLHEHETLLSERIRKHSEEIDHWRKTTEELKDSLTRSTLMADLLKASQIASEERMLAQRDRLPEIHQQVLDESLSRLRIREGILLEKEGCLRAEEARRLAAVDSLRADAMKELDRIRMRSESSLSAERADLEAERNQLERDKQEFKVRMHTELAAAQREKMDVDNMRRELSKQQEDLRIERTEFEIRVQLLQPSLHSIEQENEEVRRLKVQAMAEMNVVEAKMSAVFDADRNLIARERVVEEGLATLEQARQEIAEQTRGIQEQQRLVEWHRHSIDEERFQLHATAVEMSEHIEDMRRALITLTRASAPEDKENSSGQKSVRGGSRPERPTSDEPMHLAVSKATKALELASFALQSSAEALSTHTHTPAEPNSHHKRREQADGNSKHRRQPPHYTSLPVPSLLQPPLPPPPFVSVRESGRTKTRPTEERLDLAVATMANIESRSNLKSPVYVDDGIALLSVQQCLEKADASTQALRQAAAKYGFS